MTDVRNDYDGPDEATDPDPRVFVEGTPDEILDGTQPVDPERSLEGTLIEEGDAGVEDAGEFA